LIFQALCEWHFAEIGSSQTIIAEAIALAKKLNDTHALAAVLTRAEFMISDIFLVVQIMIHSLYNDWQIRIFRRSANSI
jgi:hypothetical protein